MGASACTMRANDPSVRGPAALNRVFTLLAGRRDGAGDEGLPRLIAGDTLRRWSTQASRTPCAP